MGNNKRKNSKKKDSSKELREGGSGGTVGSLEVVVSRYNRNTDWCEKFKTITPNCHIRIYDKENPSNPYNVPVNKGNEASTYLKYIVDEYEKLPEYTFFCHDEEFAWHHSGSIIDHYDIAMMTKQKYYNVNDKIILGDIRQNEYGYQNILEWYKEYIEEYIPFSKLPSENWTQGYRGSAQFLVHRDILCNLPKRFYERLYEWITTTEMTSAKSGRFMEWTWHLFWYVYPNIILESKLRNYNE